MFYRKKKQVVCDTEHLSLFFRVLSHCRTTSDQYTVIFTSGCTAALKMVAETFSFTDDKTCAETRPTKGSFVYLDDNHTSVIGMREAVASGVDVQCVTNQEVKKLLAEGANGRGRHGNSHQGADKGRSLFVFPAQSNFSGARYPLSWIQEVKDFGLGCHRNCCVLLDAASYMTTACLDLSKYTPDFVTLSFYKIFGFPTGLGNEAILLVILSF